MNAPRPEWCPTCRTMRDVDDVSEETQHTRDGDVTHRAVWLVCGHHFSTPLRTTANHDGEPYAGPELAGRVVSVDPWGLAGMA